MEYLVLPLIWFLIWMFSGRSGSGQEMGSLELRQVHFTLEGNGAKGIGLEIKGMIPVTSSTTISFVTSVLDATDRDADKGAAPVLSLIEAFQETQTTAYQCRQEGPRIEPMHGFSNFRGQWDRSNFQHA